jgi:hypothetical protein
MLGYFREAKKGAGLFFSAPIQSARGFGFRCYRCKAGVHAWLTVFLDSLLSQRMTERGPYPHPRKSLYIFCFSGMARH